MTIPRFATKRGLANAGRSGLGIGSAAVALLMPKCPLCFVAWAWVFSTFGLTDAIYDQWKLPFMLSALTLVVILSVRFAKPWLTSLIICVCGLGLAYKMDLDFEFSPVVIGGWILGTSLMAAVMHSYRRRAAKKSCCSVSVDTPQGAN